jgi:predicted alpha/beta-fold hydrolase
VAGDRLATLQVPTSILTSEDDPIIPVADFRALQLPAQAELRIVRHGGHCGFLENWRLESWAERFVLDTCLRIAGH